jgi:hypothetical protein
VVNWLAYNECAGSNSSQITWISTALSIWEV